VILFSLFGLSLDYLAMALAPSLAWVFAGRILSGAAAATFATSSAYIADITPPDERAARFGLVSVAIGLGYIIGPALGGVLGDVSLRLPFWVACVLTFSNFLFVAIALPESLAQSRRSSFSLRRANPVGAIALYARRSDLAALAGVVFLYYLAGQAVQNVLVPYVDFRFAWSTQMVGMALALLGIGSIAVQGLVVRPFVARFGERGALCIGLFAAALGYWVYGVAPSSVLFLSAIGLFAFSGLVMPGLQGLMSRMVSPMEQGRLQGANMGLLAISSLIGPVLFTEVFARSIGMWNGFAPLGSTWYLAGGLTLAALMLACLRRRGS
jgi:DHA1 family tetracycline resistance protein-like MFS transporter